MTLVRRLRHCFRRVRGYIPANFASGELIQPEQYLSGDAFPMNFITPAFAQTGGQPNMVMQLAPFIIILVIMYFLIIRPQQKRAKAHREMITNVRRGDTVVTSGGFIGKVTKVVDDDELEVEIAPDTRVRLVRSMIADVRVKGEPAKGA